MHSTIPSTFSHLKFSVEKKTNEERQTKWEKIRDEVKMRGRFLFKVAALLDFFGRFLVLVRFVVRRGKTFGRWVGKFWKDI